MKKKRLILISILTVVILVFGCLCGCSSSGLTEADFQLEITDISIKNNRVIVSVEFKNKSWHNGWIHTGGEPHRPSTMVQFYHTDDIENPDHDYTEHKVTHWIKSKQVITATHELQLEKGTYTITVYVDFACNDDRDHFRFVKQQVIEV